VSDEDVRITVGDEAADEQTPGQPFFRRVSSRILSRNSFLGLWVRSSLVLFVLCAMWTLATPLGGAPDEAVQVIKAAATVRGELIGQAAPGLSTATRAFRVPAVFKSVYDLPGCYEFHPSIPAGCAPHLRSSARLVTVTSYVGRYPPLYYAFVGLPTLVMHSESVIYVMRFISALIDSVLLGLALAVAAIWARSTMVFAALALTITPLVVFLCGVVNPSGFEIAAAACVWTSGLAMVRRRASDPPRGLVVTFFVTGCLLELTRGLSVLWMLLILLTMICLEPRSCRELLRNRSVRIGSLVLGAVGALAVAFVLAADTLSVVPSVEFLPQHASVAVLTEQVLGQIGGYINQFIGVFGWLDTPSPMFTIILWTSLLGFLIVLGLALSRTRHARVLLGLIGGSLVLTVLIVVWHAGSSGITWQARDGFPLYAGIPLLAGFVMSDHSFVGSAPRIRKRIAAIVAVAVGVSQLADFVWALRRNTVGLGHTMNLFLRVPGGWSPPLGTPLMVSLGAAAVALYAAWLYRQMGNRESPSASTVHPQTA
jgi:hypothetical protein